MKKTLVPAVTVWLMGWVVMTGALDGDAALTVRTAPLLVAEPALFVATAVYVPALAEVTPFKLSVVLVAPVIVAPFFFH